MAPRRLPSKRKQARVCLPSGSRSTLCDAKDHRLIVEPACGASLALVYGQDEDLKKHEKILVVVCGGVSASIEELLNWQDSGASIIEHSHRGKEFIEVLEAAKLKQAP